MLTNVRRLGLFAAPAVGLGAVWFGCGVKDGESDSPKQLVQSTESAFVTAATLCNASQTIEQDPLTNDGALTPGNGDMLIEVPVAGMALVAHTFKAIDASVGIGGFVLSSDTYLSVTGGGTVVSRVEPGGGVEAFRGPVAGPLLSDWGTLETANPITGGFRFTSPSGLIQQYDSFSGLYMPTSVTTANASRLTFARASDGRLQGITDPAGHAVATLHWTLRSHWQLDSVTTADQGDQVELYYDTVNRLQQVGYKAGWNNSPYTAFITFGYDGSGRLATMTDERGVVTALTYASNSTTAMNPVIKVATGTFVSNYEYLSASLVRRTDTTTSGATGGDEVVELTLDSSCRVSSRKHPDGSVTGITYDSLGVATWQSSAERATPCAHTTSRDDAGRLTAQSDCYGTLTTVGYDGGALPASITDQNGYVTTYTYTALGQIATWRTLLGATVVESGQLDYYDVNSDNLLKRVTVNGVVQSDYAYTFFYGSGTSDAGSDGGDGGAGGDAGSVRVPGIFQSVAITGRDTGTTTLQFDANLNPSSFRFPDNRTITTSFTPGGRLTASDDTTRQTGLPRALPDQGVSGLTQGSLSVTYNPSIASSDTQSTQNTVTTTIDTAALDDGRPSAIWRNGKLMFGVPDSGAYNFYAKP